MFDNRVIFFLNSHFIKTPNRRRNPPQRGRKPKPEQKTKTNKATQRSDKNKTRPQATKQTTAREKQGQKQTKNSSIHLPQNRVTLHARAFLRQNVRKAVGGSRIERNHSIPQETQDRADIINEIQVLQLSCGYFIHLFIIFLQ